MGSLGGDAARWPDFGALAVYVPIAERSARAFHQNLQLGHDVGPLPRHVEALGGIGGEVVELKSGVTLSFRTAHSTTAGLHPDGGHIVMGENELPSPAAKAVEARAVVVKENFARRLRGRIPQEPLDAHSVDGPRG